MRHHLLSHLLLWHQLQVPLVQASLAQASLVLVSLVLVSAVAGCLKRGLLQGALVVVAQLGEAPLLLLLLLPQSLGQLARPAELAQPQLRLLHLLQEEQAQELGCPELALAHHPRLEPQHWQEARLPWLPAWWMLWPYKGQDS